MLIRICPLILIKILKKQSSKIKLWIIVIGNSEIKVIELDIQDYENRNGYDPNFLGKVISLPSISQDLMNDIVKLKFSNDTELKYTNFSIVISKSRGLAFYTAVNIDGSQLNY